MSGGSEEVKQGHGELVEPGCGGAEGGLQITLTSAISKTISCVQHTSICGGDVVFLFIYWLEF